MPEPLPRLRQPARRHRALRRVPAAPVSQGLRQPDPGLLVILPGKSASAIAKYTITCGGSFPPFRFAPFPVASTASSTASRGTQDASTPREIQSLKRPSATLPVCDLADAVDRVKAITGRIDLVHCNNSRDEFGSGRDRHANIVAGTIDPALLLAVVRAAGAPAICETPDEDGGLTADVSWLKQHLPA
jgi:hypothetical protein